MFYLFSTRTFVFSLLLGSLFFLASCDDDADDDNEPDSVEIDETSVERSANDPALDNCKHPDNSTREKCCESIEMDDHFMKCVLLNQKKMPKEGDQNPKALVKFLSCLVECIYKGSKYIGKGDSLNMKVIKADAKKKYKEDPNMQEYMIEMYAHCERHASIDWGKMKNNPATRLIFSGACKPYLLFVYLCTNKYGIKVKCPYYAWKGTKNSKKDTISECEELKSKCEEL